MFSIRQVHVIDGELMTPSGRQPPCARSTFRFSLSVGVRFDLTTSEYLSTSTPNGFMGFTSTTPITSLDIFRVTSGTELDLDNVSLAVTQVPEPDSFYLTLAGGNLRISRLTPKGAFAYFSFRRRPFLNDANDDFILELAVSAKVRYIVTHNLRNFAGIESFGLEAVTPAQMLLTLRENN